MADWRTVIYSATTSTPRLGCASASECGKILHVLCAWWWWWWWWWRSSRRAIDRLPQPVIGFLRGIGFAQRCGFQIIGQVAIGQAAGARLPHPLRHCVNAVAVIHGGNCNADGQWGNPSKDA